MDKLVKTALIMVIVCLVVIFGGTSFITYKQSKATNILSEAMLINADTNQKLADTTSNLYVKSLTGTENSDDGSKIITPFDNIITAGE